MHALYHRVSARHPLSAGDHHTGHQQEHAGGPVVQLVHKAFRVYLQNLLLSKDGDMVPNGAEQSYHSGHVGV